MSSACALPTGPADFLSQPTAGSPQKPHRPLPFTQTAQAAVSGHTPPSRTMAPIQRQAASSLDLEPLVQALQELACSQAHGGQASAVSAPILKALQDATRACRTAHSQSRDVKAVSTTANSVFKYPIADKCELLPLLANSVRPSDLSHLQSFTSPGCNFEEYSSTPLLQLPDSGNSPACSPLSGADRSPAPMFAAAAYPRSPFCDNYQSVCRHPLLTPSL